MNTEPQEKESPRASLHETCKENIKKALDTSNLGFIVLLTFAKIHTW